MTADAVFARPALDLPGPPSYTGLALLRLAEPHHVGDEHPGLRVLHGEGEFGRPQLVRLLVHQEAVGQREPVLGLGQCRLADHRLQVEACLAVVGGVVGDQLGPARIEHLDVVEQTLCDSSITTASHSVESRWWAYTSLLSVSTEMIARLKYANGFRPAGMSCWMRWMPVESSLTSGMENRVHSSRCPSGDGGDGGGQGLQDAEQAQHGRPRGLAATRTPTTPDPCRSRQGRHPMHPAGQNGRTGRRAGTGRCPSGPAPEGSAAHGRPGTARA
ncbi:hypothetical protein ACFWC4_27360, partial [Streptomyces sp. NPDC060077]